jgi:hypothetical protein
MPAPTRTVYVVMQTDWSYDDEYYSGGNEPLKAFTDREQAEAYRARCEHRVALGWEEIRDQTDRHFTVVEMQVAAGS